MPNTERVLVLLPPHTPSQVAVEEHLALFQVGRWLRETGRFTVDILDAGALNVTWSSVAEILFRGYDHIVLMNDIEGHEAFSRAIAYIKALSPDAKVTTFGRLGRLAPGLFTRFDIDAVVESGDPEVGVALALTRGRNGGALPGVHVRDDDRWLAPSSPGRYLDAEDLVRTLPDPAEIPYAAYERLAAELSPIGSGVRELVVPIARDAPPGSSDGLHDRRIGIEAAIGYIRAAEATGRVDLVSLVAPIFTLSQSWTRRWCESIVADGRPRRWRCKSALAHLDGELIARMGASGCVRIDVGIDAVALEASARHVASDALDRVGAGCAIAGIELGCMVTLGLPSAELADTRRAIDHARRVGGRVRPVVYTHYDRIHAAMSSEEVATFTRDLLPASVPALDAHLLYRMFLGREPPPDSLPARSGIPGSGIRAAVSRDDPTVLGRPVSKRLVSPG